MHVDPALVDPASRLNGALLRDLGRRLLQWLGRAASRGRGLALLLIVALAVVRAWDPLPVEIIRLKTFDNMQRLLPKSDAPPLVPVVVIDEASLDSIGQWPWSRKTMAKLVGKLMEMGAVVVGFDIVFAEPDRMSPVALAAEVADLEPAMARRLEKLPTNDSIFARRLARSRVVLGRFGDAATTEGEAPVLARKATVAWVGVEPRPWLFPVAGLITNLPELERAATGIGFLSLQPEQDNIVRRVAAVVRQGDAILPTLGVEMLRVATGRPTIAVKADAAGLNTVIIAGVRVPVDNQGRMWLKALRRAPSRYLSAGDVLAGRVAPARVKGRLVLVGAAAAGLRDLRSTPLESGLPAVEVHAHLIENMIQKTHLIRPYYGLGMEVVILVVLGLAMIVVLPMIGARWTLLALLVIGGGLIGGAVYFLREHLMLVDPSYPVLAAAVVYTYLSYASHVSEERQRLFIRGAFSQYLSPALVERLAGEPGSLKLGGEVREMTFLFCDIRGFTSISEGFKSDPQGLTRLINQFLTPMTDAILARQGTIDKYMGDCVMAFWNAPFDDPEHARHACNSALVMRRELEALNQRLAAEAEAEGREATFLRVGVGLNTGECVVGNMGSEQRFDYSVLGDAVNLASRLEGQSTTYGVDIVIGEDTARAVSEFAMLELDLIAVKGKAEAVRIYALLGDGAARLAPEFKRLAALQEAMLAAYRSQQWDQAAAGLAEIRGADSALGTLCDLYEERIRQYRLEPPDSDWDGVFVATEK